MRYKVLVRVVIVTGILIFALAALFAYVQSQ